MTSFPSAAPTTTTPPLSTGKRTDGTNAVPACSNTQWDRFSIDRNHLWGNTHFASSIALAG
jgi:hypothetical protein